MPEYFAEKVLGHWLYFTTHCILEAMHVHASRDGKLREKGAAKFFVYADGTSRMMQQGTLRDHEVPGRLCVPTGGCMCGLVNRPG